MENFVINREERGLELCAVVNGVVVETFHVMGDDFAYTNCSKYIDRLKRDKEYCKKVYELSKDK